MTCMNSMNNTDMIAMVEKMVDNCCKIFFIFLVESHKISIPHGVATYAGSRQISFSIFMGLYNIPYRTKKEI